VKSIKVWTTYSASHPTIRTRIEKAPSAVYVRQIRVQLWCRRSSIYVQAEDRTEAGEEADWQDTEQVEEEDGEHGIGDAQSPDAVSENANGEG
jgi:hypothetical protein